MFFRSITNVLFIASLRTAWAHPESLESRKAALEPVSDPDFALQSRAVTINTFDYTPTNGPLTWHKVNGNEKCGRGTNQSPILLDSASRQTAVGALTYSGGNTEGELENRGTAIEVVHANGSVRFAGADYALDNFHFHTPSEHRVNKEYYPLEMHMVHKTSAGKALVLGFLFQLSTTSSSPFLRDSLRNLNQVTRPGSAIGTGPMNLTGIANYVSTKRFYEYDGSLTTPPCTEGIKFMIGTEPLSLDVTTYNTLKSIVKFNSRIAQNAPGQQNVIQAACYA